MVKTLTENDKKNALLALTDPALMENIAKLAEMLKLLSEVLPKFEVKPMYLKDRNKHYIAILIEKPDKENVSA